MLPHGMRNELTAGKRWKEKELHKPFQLHRSLAVHLGEGLLRDSRPGCSKARSRATSFDVPVSRCASRGVRYLIDTVFGQLTDRWDLKRIWARDLWHLRNRLLRAILMHTLCFWFNQQDEAPRLQFDRLVA